MPFGMVDMQDNWVPNPQGYKPNIGLAKIFWNPELEHIKIRYNEAKDMLAEDEWLKGIESERDYQTQEFDRITKFEKTQEFKELSKHFCAFGTGENQGTFWSQVPVTHRFILQCIVVAGSVLGYPC